MMPAPTTTRHVMPREIEAPTTNRSSRPDWALVADPRDWTEVAEAEVNGDYVFSGNDAEAARIAEIAKPLMEHWTRPVSIEYAHDVSMPAIRHQWQIEAVGRDAQAIAAIMKRWGCGSVRLRSTPNAAGSVHQVLASLEVPHAVVVQVAAAVHRRDSDSTIPRKHARLHRIAEATGGWECFHCGVRLVDVCSGDDVTLDTYGKRLLKPGAGLRLPTVDHLVPQALGGSNAIANLVLACRSCNSSKGAQ